MRSEGTRFLALRGDGQRLELLQLVPEVKRMVWHAGIFVVVRRYRHRSSALDLGIEICNPGHNLGYPDFPAR